MFVAIAHLFLILRTQRKMNCNIASISLHMICVVVVVPNCTRFIVLKLIKNLNRSITSLQTCYYSNLNVILRNNPDASNVQQNDVILQFFFLCNQYKQKQSISTAAIRFFLLIGSKLR